MTLRTLTFALAAISAAAAQVPRPAPDLTIYRNPAAPLHLKSLRGKVVVLTFIYST